MILLKPGISKPEKAEGIVQDIKTSRCNFNNIYKLSLAPTICKYESKVTDI